jgi:aryl sulfotransferase
MSGIVWLASYPKSGNTWFRVFLTNLQRDAAAPVDINDLNATPMASARQPFDEAVGYEAGDLTPDEIEVLRPRVYEYLTAATAETLFMKIHDAYTLTATGEPLVSPRATRGALYFLRNPLDVCVSFAHHSACDVEPLICAMANLRYALSDRADRVQPQLRQRLLCWSQHVLSWVDGAPFPVLVVRYEDMHLQPLETFTRAAAFAGLPHEPQRIARAVRQSAFMELQQQEHAHGFHEKMPRAASFFRQGTIGSWRTQLTPEQTARLIADHGDVMRRFGYVSTDGTIVF